jgi:hypothetical protein
VIPLATQLRHLHMGDFGLTGAVRPCRGSSVVPTEGYRLEHFRDPESRRRIPLLAAAVSAERLFDVFLDLLAPLGETVNVVLEASHDYTSDRHDDLCRSDIDLPVLASHLCDHEELLLKDGCAGVAVLAQDRPIEVQFDEHKLLYVYAYDLKPFRRILAKWGIQRIDDMRLIAEAEHVHHSTPTFAEEFRQLSCRLGAGEIESVLSDENEWSEGW